MPTLEFNGKHHIYTHHLSVPYRPLETDENRSCNPIGTDDNLIIEGDNLRALKALLPRYKNRIKCIYIDPPYNTGNEGWSYNDNVNNPLMQAWFNENSPIDNEDLERHEKWLCIMWPRLHLLKELLAEDGVIFVSIDDNEVHHLRMLMDEIFDEKNFVECFIWKKKGGAGNTEQLVGDIVEYVLMYARDIRNLSTNRRIIESSTYPYRDEEGSYKLEGLLKTDRGEYKRDTMKFPVPVPNTDEEARPPEGKRWTVGKNTMMDLLQLQLLHFTPSEDGWIVKKKKYFDEADPDTGVYLNLLLEQGSLKVAKNELVSLGFEREAFSTPKPLVLVKQLLRIICNPNDIILDAFAGSGTTAHAALSLNKEDDGNRKFVLIECKDTDTITAERVRRVINGVPDASADTLREGLGGSFTYCTLGEPIEIEAMLTGKGLPPYPALATNLLFTAAGISVEEDTLDQKNDDGLFFSDDKNDYYLIYKPDLAFLRSNEAILNLEQAKRIRDSSQNNGKKAIVYAAGNYIGQRELTKMGIAFCQLPYSIHER